MISESKTEKYLKAALKDGYIPHKDDLFLIQGPGGVGKSSLISMFLGKQRDITRISTAVAEESLHISPVRDVSTTMLTNEWKVVDIDRQAQMVAQTSQQLGETTFPAAKIDDITISPPVGVKSEVNKKPGQHQRQNCQYPSAYMKPKKRLPYFASQIAKLNFLTKKTLTKSLDDDPEQIEAFLAKFQENILDLMHVPRKFLDLILYHSIRVVDSGGQPQFHEVVSIILPAATGIVSVFKLSESLDVHGEVVFFKEGVQANDPYKSYLTNEEVIRHNLLAIQSEASCNRVEEIPNLAFVGTFLDQQEICTEQTPDQKDERLHSMITDILPEELQHCVLSSGKSLKNVTFRLNTRTPSRDDYETVKRLKNALTQKSQVKPKNLPFKWFSYEIALHQLMNELGRQTLSLQECEFVGYKLRFDQPSLKACLNYLRDLHVISFYDVVPSIVFGSSQVILDKITELVIYSLELKKGNLPLGGVDRKFHQQGILSTDILQSDKCSKHYNKYFTQDCLLKILQSLFIITQVRQGEYLMPCVLDVSDIFPSFPATEGNIKSSFVLHFSKKSPMLGIYCSTISYLLTKAGWNLLIKGGEVVQVARNSICFKLPRGLPGKLTFLDPLSSYFEIVLELPAIVAAEHSAMLYREIHDTFFVAIKRAMKNLHYKVRTPELSFLCPEQSSRCSVFPHIANVNDSHSFLTCSISPDSVTSPLTPDQKMWLNSSQICEFSSSFTSHYVFKPFYLQHLTNAK